MPTTLQFCGAARTVTGSKHLLNLNGKKILVDCGMFQGPEIIRSRNDDPWPFDPASLDAVVVTHAHMDHIGMLPRLIKDGYQGPIYATKATIGLAKVSLPDSGRLQEEEADYRRRKGLPGATPIYTERDAFACLKSFEPVRYYEFHPLPGGATWRYLPAGHILGSAFAEIYFENGERIMMSGDLGRFNTPIIKDPSTVEFAEYLVIESTYGDRLHSEENPMSRLEDILNSAIRDGNCVIVPSFAIGRTQELLYLIARLQEQNRIGRIPIFVDSPMATSVTDLYSRSREEHDHEMEDLIDVKVKPIEPDNLEYVRDRDASKALNVRTGPMVIISGSGMANGGRVVHHLISRLGDPSTVVVFTGYQAEGTLGRRILEREETVEIMGRTVDVRAIVTKLNSLSAHCDQGEMLEWLSHFKAAPKRTFIVHGEPAAQDVLKAKIEEEFGWPCEIPDHLSETVLF